MNRFILALLMAAVVPGRPAGAHWRQFHGADNRSISQATGLPVCFDVETGENVAWKAPLPGRGASGPIVVGDRVIVTASDGPRQDRLHVLCFDAATGNRLWHRQLWATGATVVNPFSAVAAPAPASDGRLDCVSHSGLVQVVELGEKGRIVARCMLEEGTLGSPAVAPRALCFRSHANLWKISSEGSL